MTNLWTVRHSRSQKTPGGVPKRRQKNAFNKGGRPWLRLAGEAPGVVESYCAKCRIWSSSCTQAFCGRDHPQLAEALLKARQAEAEAWAKLRAARRGVL